MVWCFVDEREDQRDQFSQLLRNHGVEVESVQPGSDFGFTHGPVMSVTGFILDYALHEQDSAIRYSGATLAAQIRQDHPECPIVILSAFLREPATNERLRRTRDLIDLQVKKDEVEQQPEKFARQLQSLSAGYARIGESFHRVDDPEMAARSILGLNQAIADEPALEEVVTYLAQVGNKDCTLTALLLLHELLKLPGPVLMPEHAAIVLGIDPQHSHDDTLYQLLEPARYRGAFQDIYWDRGSQIPLFWRSRLIGLKADLPTLPQALCFICRKAASTLCAECEKPIDGLHSLPAQRGEVTFPECREARICGNCLRKDKLKSGVTLDLHHAALKADIVKECRNLLRESQKVAEG